MIGSLTFGNHETLNPIVAPSISRKDPAAKSSTSPASVRTIRRIDFQLQEHQSPRGPAQAGLHKLGFKGYGSTQATAAALDGTNGSAAVKAESSDDGVNLRTVQNLFFE
jgi:hypothetical protein